MAKPRVFVSSTYYDLKYVRERLERLISSYCFEPILFESDNVYFNPTDSLDNSCYEEIKTCHMMILIVGGRYGTNATETQKEEYEKKHISITQKEYETAIEKNIPVMVFVEQNVYTEYKTFSVNKYNDPEKLNYAFVDDIRIFEFISKLEQGAIKAFNKVDDIEHYFSHQIAGMLLDYLLQLQINKTNIEIDATIKQLQKTSNNMQDMLNTVAKKILKGADQIEYQKIVQEQKKSLVDFFLDMMSNSVFVTMADYYDTSNARTYAIEISQMLVKYVFNNDVIDKYNSSDLTEKLTIVHMIDTNLKQQIENKYSDIKIRFHLSRYIKQLCKIWQEIRNEQDLLNYFQNELTERIFNDLLIPF